MKIIQCDEKIFYTELSRTAKTGQTESDSLTNSIYVKILRQDSIDVHTRI